MSYPSISKLIKNFQFSPHFDDRFETGNDSTRYFSGERNTVHWKGKHSRISECIFVPYSTFIYTYPPLQFKSAHYTLRDFLFEMVIRWNKLRRSHVSHRMTRRINFIPGPEKHRWNLIRRVRNQSSRNGCRFDPESCYLQSSFTPFSWSYTRTSKGIRFARCNKESMDKSDNNHWEVRLAAVNEPTTIHSNLSRFRFLPWTTSSFVCIAGYADWLASTQVGALPPTKSENTIHVVAPIAWLHGLVSCAPPCRRMLHTRCINMYLN